LASNFVDFALCAFTLHGKNLEGWFGTRAGFWKS